MEKHKKMLKRALLVIVFVFVAFFGVRSIMSFATDTSDTSSSGIERRETTTEKTTDGEQCGSAEEMNGHYNPRVTFDTNARTATITVSNGSFRVTSVSDQSLLLDNPMTMGNLTSNSPLVIHYGNVSGELVIHFVLAETDDMCLSYDEAKVLEGQDKKFGTYEFDMTLQLAAQMDTPKRTNENYNGICAAFRNGTGYDTYQDVLSSAGVNQNEFETYNYAAVSDAGKRRYEQLLSYCFTADQVNFNYTEAQVASMINSSIDIWRKEESSGAVSDTPVSEDFMAAFNDAKEKALALGHDYSSRVTDGSLDDSRFGMVCDWQKKATGTTGDDYYVNKDYYYAKEEDVENVSYNYHYTGSDENTPGVTETVSGGSCKRVCEESVVAEYGPPVASKAGLCFEYKVRVTSRVICETDTSAIVAPEEPEICTPTPVCNQISGREHQGGPNDEFEQCIDECDGGEYSASCSNKCYQEVYGESEDYDPLALHYDTSAMADTDGDNSCPGKEGFPGYAGRYQWENGKIVWVSEGDTYTYARWYRDFPGEAERTCNDHGTYRAYANGFKRRDKGNGNYCQDNCEWQAGKCTEESYLNDEDAAEDRVENMKKYNQAISQCQASASCTTKTAYFEISVDYTHDVDGTTKEETITFPYNSSEQSSLPSLGQGNESKSPVRPEIFLSDGEDYQGYDGCYVESNARNWYQAEWSFPGTWINNKSGEITFVDKTGNNAWHLKEDKFCVPLDAKSVNTLWWEWSEVGDTCYPADQISSSIDYNIHASTTDFGFFGWNFDFECFYALRNEVCDITTNGCCNIPGDPEDPTPDCPPGECPPDEDPPTSISTRDYAFRIVDTSDMFPEQEDGIDENVPKIEGVGRQPGYNWTLGMTSEDTSILMSLNDKNPDYKIDPLSLISNIQERRDSIYSDDSYIDYKFILDTETLAKIRQFNRNKKYTDFDGEARTKNGLTVYYSDLWSEIGDAVITRGTPGVNNEGEGA